MYETILNFPKQFKKGLAAVNHLKISQSPQNIIICGMGGSAIPALLLKTCFPFFKTPLYLHRNYHLPPQANKKSLIIAISYSGNTEETISAFETSLKKGITPTVITTGGKLAELARKKSVPLVLLPDEKIQPRSAAGLMFAALAKILCNAGIINKTELEKIAKLEKTLKPKEFENKSRRLAKNLKGKIPLIYSSDKFKAVARVWKINFNENSKIPAFWNYFPELNHNEMNGFENARTQLPTTKFAIIILEDKQDHPRILKRMQLTAEMLRGGNLTVDFIKIKGKNELEKTFNTLLFGELTAYYLAKEQKINPEPVKMVEELKKKLER